MSLQFVICILVAAMRSREMEEAIATLHSPGETGLRLVQFFARSCDPLVGSWPEELSA